MLYFKTKKGRLVIQLHIDENQYIYMLICPLGDDRVFGYYDYTNEKVWEQFKKIAEPDLLEENDADYQMYDQAIEKENASQQEMANLEERYQQALRGSW